MIDIDSSEQLENIGMCIFTRSTWLYELGFLDVLDQLISDWDRILLCCTMLDLFD